jgi:hypothetical protein
MAGGAVYMQRKQLFGPSLKTLGACLATVATLIAVCTGLAGAGTASAELRAAAAEGTSSGPGPGSTWDISPTPDPSGDWGAGADNVIDGVSCASATFCMASGYYVPRPEKPQTYFAVPLFERWDGSSWSTLSPPEGTATSEDEVEGISCPTVDFCMAVGSAQGRPGAQLAESNLALRYDGTWSVVPVPNPPLGEGLEQSELSDVSCTSPSACVAVGSVVYSRFLSSKAVIEQWNGVSWSLVNSPSVGAENELDGVSCTTNGGARCVAVGAEDPQSNQGTPNINGHGVVEVDQGGEWSVAAKVDAIAANHSNLTAVSCLSGTDCVAVGLYQIGHDSFLLDDNWDGRAWAPVHTPPTFGPAVGVSCTAATNCLDVGGAGKVARWDGTSWDKVPTPADQIGGSVLTAKAISCVPDLCTVAGGRLVDGSTATWVEQGAQQNVLKIHIEPVEVTASGLATAQITITVLSPTGDPVPGAEVVVQPPAEVGTDGVANGLVCDSDNNLMSPLRQSDGSLLGHDFTKTTDDNGEIHLTLHVGTLSGRWLMDAYEPGLGGTQPKYASVDVDPVPSRADIDPNGDLVGELISQGNSTLTHTGQNVQRNVLEWLGEVKPSLGSVGLGVGYIPIVAVDAAGGAHAGVVLYAPGAAAERNVLDYLDGLSTTPPPEKEAVVIDITNARLLLAVGKATGNLIQHPPYRLPSLGEWADGTRIQIAEQDQGIFSHDGFIPIPARGRPHFGLLDPKGNEALLYGYGPYLPSPSTSQAAVALEHCVGG